MRTIHQTYLIHAPLTKVWQALINPTEIEKWGGGPAKITAKVGTAFSLWGGTIHGTNIEVQPEKLLVQDWISDSEARAWKTPSVVRFELQSKKDVVELQLIHTGVPEADQKNIADGWKEYYLGPLKDYLESKSSAL